MSDINPPKITELYFYPASVNTSDSPQYITVIGRITDNLSGNAGIEYSSSPSQIRFRSPTGNQFSTALLSESQRISGTAQDGTYKSIIVIPQFSESGLWEVEHLHLVDQVGNSEYIYTDELKSNGFFTQFSVQGEQDITPPSIYELNFTPRVIDTSSSDSLITISAKIQDDISGNAGNGYSSSPSQIRFRSPSGNQFSTALLSEPERISGTALEGIYQSSLELPKFSENGLWKVEHLLLVDQVGNSKYIYYNELRNRGFDTNFNISNENNESTSLYELTVQDSSVLEGDEGYGFLIFNPTLNREPTEAFDINYRILDSGSASPGIDYFPIEGSLAFQPNQTTSPLAVLIAGDNLIENDETIKLNFSSNSISRDVFAQGLIIDDDGIISSNKYKLSINQPYVLENDSGVTLIRFLLNLDKEVDEDFLVNYYTFGNGEATPDIDFVSSKGSITFKSGSDKAFLDIQVIGDLTHENNETFNILFSSNKISESIIATGQIFDNDTFKSLDNNQKIDLSKGINITTNDDGNKVKNIELNGKDLGFLSTQTLDQIGSLYTYQGDEIGILYNEYAYDVNEYFEPISIRSGDIDFSFTDNTLKFDLSNIQLDYIVPNNISKDGLIYSASIFGNIVFSGSTEDVYNGIYNKIISNLNIYVNEKNNFGTDVSFNSIDFIIDGDFQINNDSLGMTIESLKITESIGNEKWDINLFLNEVNNTYKIELKKNEELLALLDYDGSSKIKTSLNSDFITQSSVDTILNYSNNSNKKSQLINALEGTRDFEEVLDNLVDLDLNLFSNESSYSEILESASSLLDSFFDINMFNNSKEQLESSSGIIRGQSYYRIVEGPSWAKAESNANKLGGNLVTINDKEEQDFIIQEFSNLLLSDFNDQYQENIGSKRAWIGLREVMSPFYKESWACGCGSTFRGDDIQAGLKVNSGLATDGFKQLLLEDHAADLEIKFSGIEFTKQLNNKSGGWITYRNSNDISYYDGSIDGIAEVPLSYFSVSDLTLNEGSTANITISRTGGFNTEQNLTLRSSDGSALSGLDYLPINQTISFSKGEKLKSIPIKVLKDNNTENKEKFYLNIIPSIYDQVPAQLNKSQAAITIQSIDQNPIGGSTLTASQIQQLYIAVFGRPADPPGLDYWTSKNITAKEFASDLFAQDEYNNQYGNGSIEYQVNEIYKNLFGRSADVPGLLYWTNEIMRGNIKLSSIVNDLIFTVNNNSESRDAKVLENRTNTANRITSIIASNTACILEYQPIISSSWKLSPLMIKAKDIIANISEKNFYTNDQISRDLNCSIPVPVPFDPFRGGLADPFDPFRGGFADPFSPNYKKAINISNSFDEITGIDNDVPEHISISNENKNRLDAIDFLKWAGNTTRQVNNSSLITEDFVENYGSNVSDSIYIDRLYTNVLGRLTDADGKDYLLRPLSSGPETRAEAFLGFAESTENKEIFSDMTGGF